MSLLVVGSLALDTIETPFGKAERAVGGSATYISLSASYFLQPVRLVGVVGGDFPKKEIEFPQGAVAWNLDYRSESKRPASWRSYTADYIRQPAIVVE